VGKEEPSHTLGGDVVKPLWKTAWKFLKNPKKLKLEVPYDHAIPLLAYTQRKAYTSGCSRATCTPMFTATLFTIAKLWKQPRCSTTDE
jgi:hypothetical protein